MRRIIFSPKAKADLSQIWDYTYTEWGAEQADKYIRELWAAIEDQSCDLTKSLDISDVRAGYRKVRSGSLMVFLK